MRNLTVCFTGHRNISDIAKKKIEKSLEKILTKLIENGCKFFGAGGAIGFDTIAALTVLKLKELYPHIKLILVLPCKSQTNGWQNKDKEIYEWIKSKSDKVVYTSIDYSRGCMHKRNRHLGDNSSICVCYLTEKS